MNIDRRIEEPVLYTISLEPYKRSMGLLQEFMKANPHLGCYVGLCQDDEGNDVDGHAEVQATEETIADIAQQNFVYKGKNKPWVCKSSEIKFLNNMRPV